MNRWALSRKDSAMRPVNYPDLGQEKVLETLKLPIAKQRVLLKKELTQAQRRRNRTIRSILVEASKTIIALEHSDY
jgi:hypothetical protein